MDLCIALEHSQTVGVIATNVNGIILNANAHAAEMFELDRLALIGRNLMEFVAQEARLNAYRRLEAVRNGDLHYVKTTKPCTTINGRRFMASCEFWVLKDGNTPQSVEMIMYLLPNGKDEAVILEMKQEIDTLKQLVMGLIQHSKVPINIHQITGGDNKVGDNHG